jgi:hypothetical protein
MGSSWDTTQGLYISIGKRCVNITAPRYKNSINNNSLLNAYGFEIKSSWNNMGVGNSLTAMSVSLGGIADGSSAVVIQRYHVPAGVGDDLLDHPVK